MGLIPALIPFSPGTVIRSNDVNANFNGLRDTLNATGMFTDVPRTVTAPITFSAAIVFGGMVSIGGEVSVTGVVTATTDIVVGGIVRKGTADGADNSLLTLAGGGAGGFTRGAHINLFGNEAASLPGVMQLVGGGTAALEFYTNNILRGRVISSGEISWNFDIFTTGHVITGNVRRGSSAGADNGQLILQSSGGTGGGTQTRGAYINLSGNEFAGKPGWVEIFSGIVGGVAGKIDFWTSAWCGGFTAEGILSLTSDIVVNGSVRKGTVDGADNGVLTLSGGGALSASRGATIAVYGNEHALLGGVDIATGNVNGGNGIRFITGVAGGGAVRGRFRPDGPLELSTNIFMAGNYLALDGAGGVYIQQYPSAGIMFFNAGTAQAMLDPTLNAFRPNTTNVLSCGHGAAVWTAVYATNGAIQPCARSLKNVAGTLSGNDALEAARAMNVYKYNYINHESPQVGVMLDELPDWLRTTEDGLNYGSLAATTLAAVKGLLARVEALEAA